MNEVLNRQIGILGLPVAPCDEIMGYRILRKDDPDDGYHLDIMIMMCNIRLVETPVACPLVYDRYWCYEGANWPTFLRVVGLGYEWNRESDEPYGWIKTWDGRRGPSLRDLALRPR